MARRWSNKNYKKIMAAARSKSSPLKTAQSKGYGTVKAYERSIKDNKRGIRTGSGRSSSPIITRGDVAIQETRYGEYVNPSTGLGYSSVKPIRPTDPSVTEWNKQIKKQQERGMSIATPTQKVQWKDIVKPDAKPKISPIQKSIAQKAKVYTQTHRPKPKQSLVSRYYQAKVKPYESIKKYVPEKHKPTYEKYIDIKRKEARIKTTLAEGTILSGKALYQTGKSYARGGLRDIAEKGIDPMSKQYKVYAGKGLVKKEQTGKVVTPFFTMDVGKPSSLGTKEDVKTFRTLTGATALMLTPVAPLVEGYFAYEGGKLVKEASTMGFTPEAVSKAQLGGLMLLPAVKGIKTKVKDIYRTRGMTKIEMAELKTKPFARTGEDLYMRRYEGFKLTQPKSWKPTIKGQKKGQFVKRQYRRIDPKVQAHMEGKSSVTYWDVVDGKSKQITAKTTQFPYEPKQTHQAWFESKSKTKYGLPKRTELKKYGKRPFGESATGEAWGSRGDIPIQYYSGKGTSAYFLRLGGEEAHAIGINPFSGLLGDKPVVYGGYFKGTKRVSAAGEVKVDVGGGKMVKTYKWKQEPKKGGYLNIPEAKLEVEALALDSKAIPLRDKYYFELKGRKIPIKEELIVGAQEAEAVGLSLGKKVKEVGYSEIPKSTKKTVPYYTSSIIKPKTSYVSAYKTSVKPSMSYIEYSKISRVKPSKVSYKPKPSKIYKSSEIGSSIAPSSISSSSISSSVGRSSTSSYISKTTTSRTPYLPPKSYISKLSKTKTPPSRIEKRSTTSKKVRNILQRARGFAVFVKEKGEFKKISTKDLTRSQAIKLGEKRTRETLKATFKIKQTGKTVEGVEKFYKPSEKVYRTYQKRKGLKLPMEETWIQKRKYRLGTMGEKKEIQTAKKASSLFSGLKKSKKRSGGLSWI